MPRAEDNGNAFAADIPIIAVNVNAGYGVASVPLLSRRNNNHALASLIANNSWTSWPIYFSVATSLTNDEPKSINLTSTIGHGKKPARKRDDTNCHWLPSNFNRNDEAFRKTHIYPLFIRTYAAAGLKIHARYVSRRSAISFHCYRGCFHNEDASKKHYVKLKRKTSISDVRRQQRPKKSLRPIKRLPVKKTGDFGEDCGESSKNPPGDDGLANSFTCTFKFCAYWDETVERWCLPHQQAGSTQHCGHAYFDSNVSRLQSSAIPDESERQVTREFPTSPIAEKTCPQSNSAYDEFMPMYRGLCKLADASGDHGSLCRDIMSKGMNTIRREMDDGGAVPGTTAGDLSQVEGNRFFKSGKPSESRKSN